MDSKIEQVKQHGNPKLGFAKSKHIFVKGITPKGTPAIKVIVNK